MDEHTKREIREAVQDAFSAGVENKRFVDVSRVPLICQSIVSLADDMKDLKESMVTQDQFWPVKTLVYTIVGIMLTSMVLALVSMVLINQ